MRTVAEKGVSKEAFVVTCSLESKEDETPETKTELNPEKEQSDKGDEDEKTIHDAGAANERPKIDPRDPIRWFGVLVPPPLRSAQSKFIAVVEGSVPQIVTLTKELRALEIDIGRIRKSIKKLEKI